PSHALLGRDAQATLCLGETPKPHTLWHGHLARAFVARTGVSMPRRRGRRRDGLDKTVQATLCLGETPKPHTLWHGRLARAFVARTGVSVREGLDKTVQATLCLGETPKPRFAWARRPSHAPLSSARRQRYIGRVCRVSVSLRDCLGSRAM
ncbi:MAG: hypothetical protein NZ556_08300, partial [Fimbriimonadales bacterium]|nr:hypothetical protein [Fimbriimonadales bacterium]